MKLLLALGNWIVSIGLIALLYLSSYELFKGVLSDGGSCATGGPYAIDHPCSSSDIAWGWGLTAALPAVIIWMFIASTRARNFVWCALFLGMGAGGIIGGFAIYHKTGNLGGAIGLWVGCGAVGLLLGIPGLIGLFRGDVPSKPITPTPGYTGGITPTGFGINERRDKIRRAVRGGGQVEDRPTMPSGQGGIEDRLAKIADLRTRGMLTDLEFEKAKSEILNSD